MRAALVLEDGRAFTGTALGADVRGEGEVVFNTAMTGYQEVLTDPSYAGQMLCMTYPLQGNYGVSSAFAESGRAWARGFIARGVCAQPSHHASEASLHSFLERHGVPGIAGVDTRALTRHLRTRGALRAVLVHQRREPDRDRLEELAELARQVAPISEQDLVEEVSREAAEEWLEPLPVELRAAAGASGDAGAGLTIAVVDYGVKANILRSLRERGCRVVVLPHTAGWEDVAATGADGLLLSNGPGDPARLEGPVELCRLTIGRIPVFGICLGHQVLGRAIGGTTSRLPFGHHGANHPVEDEVTGEVFITSQNHEFQVDRASLPEGSGFFAWQRNLHDGSVEGLAHETLPVMSVQYHPEGAPGPQDAQHLYARFLEMVRAGRPGSAPAVRGPRERPRKVLVIGSGPIVIGQAAEFDYAGTQACRALREEGVETVLVNSNPATIMTDENVADAVYIEPLTVEVLSRIIERERPDGLLPTLGGQTALNLAVALHEAGVLDRWGVRLLGAGVDTIRRAEDREAFRAMLLELGEPVPESQVCDGLEPAREFAAQVGLPLVVRPAYTLGGTGGGFVTDAGDLDRVVEAGLAASPIRQVLVERSVYGWKELEYEVMRDASGTCVTVCSMENVDPMGVHTGDSIVVAPAQTLSDRDHQMLRSSAIRIIRALGIEGGCNVQFALDPASSRYHVIEVNPRVSRSSALASKATGYPIARVAAKVAAGRLLHEIPNQVTGRTGAAFEPALDYCVVKVPRWPFDKFPGGDRRLGTQMKSTGEVMAVERTFEAALLKALRSLEMRPPAGSELAPDALVDIPNDRRLFALLDRLRAGASPEELARRTGVDRWFLDRMRALGEPTPDRPVTYKMVDTCAGEFEARTPYFYSCHEEEDEAGPPAPGRAAVVVGSGPIRIGQGIEFDYCSVQAARALREAGVRSVMVNSNPETVSTDFDTSDRLYFEPLDATSVAAVARREGAEGALVQFGGQTSINLAEPLERLGVPVLGSSAEAIDLAEERRALARELESIGIPQPLGAATTSVEEALEIAGRTGYPVVVRPSYVLGGRAMEIVRGPGELELFMGRAVAALPRGTVLVDRYLAGVEVEVDAVSDGDTVVIPGVMQHVERAGVHSGDSYAVYPALGLDAGELDLVASHTVRISRHLGLRGLVNVQYVVHEGEVHVIEVNPRASRTVPFISKATGVPMVRLAARVMLGETLASMGWATGRVADAPLVAVKAPVFSMGKLAAVDSYLGPEMRSTGEVMGIDRDLSRALQKAFLAAGVDVRPPRAGDGARAALLTIADPDKEDAVLVARRLAKLGFALVATEGTAAALARSGLEARVVAKIGGSGPTVLTAIERGEVDLVVNTMSNTWSTSPAGSVMGDGFEIRRAAVERRIPCLTSLDTAAALVESAAAVEGDLEIRTLKEWRLSPVRV